MTITATTLTLTTESDDGSKQQSRDHLTQLIQQLPSGYLRDILKTESSDILRAIADDVCFIDYAADLRAQQDRREQLKELDAQLVAKRGELDAKNREIVKAERRLSDIEDTRRELRRELSAV